ncbi:hypothetical protein EUX98_g9792 [Antrodiella citrinella]|uniref:hAT-like transposase RNase-H fold domain-containing protein n=1 Tax=Antrodiella citrinella TaxID=2447956 RepID=A0A4S4LMJ1_9APHY|nr:hypothetical protein EUX98_g9792 [Antrodiella citrinella]
MVSYGRIRYQRAVGLINVHGRDEIGLIRSIAVKERSSAKRKQIFRSVQEKASQKPLQLLLDMKVHWSSTFAMIHRAVTLREHVDVFVYEIAREEKDRTKCTALDNLQLVDEEWDRATIFLQLLGHAVFAQQAFSYGNVSTMHQAFPALEMLYKAWSSRAERPKYKAFAPALKAAYEKVEEYYDKTGECDAYIVTAYLVPNEKGAHFKRHWDADLKMRAEEVIQKIFEQRYKEMCDPNSGSAAPVQVKRKQAKRSLKLQFLLDELLSEDDSDSDNDGASVDPDKPWLAEFQRYLSTRDIVASGVLL